jgi:hypothetical protein
MTRVRIEMEDALVQSCFMHGKTQEIADVPNERGDQSKHSLNRPVRRSC